MVAPVITFWNSGDTSEYTSLDYGSIDSGQTTAVTTINIWNDKGGTASSSTATSTIISVLTSTGGSTGNDLVEDKWYNVECTSYGDVAYTAIGGATTKAIGYASADQTIPSNQKAVILTKLIVPSGTISGTTTFKVRVSYTYT